MQAFGKDRVFLKQFIRNLRGGSQPILALASDGLSYVVKFSNNLQGPNLPFNESMGSEVYRACGLAVPSWKPLMVSERFVGSNPDCWMQTPEGSLRPASGLCFGSLFLGEGGKRLLEILPVASFQRVRNRNSFWLAWLIDICAAHADNRQAVFVQDVDSWLDAFFIDHGHLFGGPNADLKKNFQISGYLDPRMYQSVSSFELLSFQKIVLNMDADRLWQKAETLPFDWKTASAADGFAQFLNRLATSSLVQSVLDTVLDCVQRTNARESPDFESGRNPGGPILRAGLQGAESEQGPVSYPACA